MTEETAGSPRDSAAEFAEAKGLEGLPPELADRVKLARSRRVRLAREDAGVFAGFVVRDEKSGRPIRLPELHREWHRILNRSARAVLWSCVETGKTVELSVARMLWELGRDVTMRGGVVSNTYAQAVKIVRAIGAYIETSPELHEVFPTLEKGEPWQANAITVRRPLTVRDPSIQAYGVHGAVLGARIDRLAIDDILDHENTSTSHARRDLYDWFYATMLGRLTERARAWAVGTAFHKEDLLHALVKAPSIWTEHRFPILNAAGCSAWPERWPEDRIAAKRIELGELEFARQMMCKARSDEDARFKQEWIDVCLRRGDGAPLLGKLDELPPGCATFTGVDVGVRTTQGSDLTVLFTLLLWPTLDRQILNVEAGRWSGPEIVRRVVDAHRRYQSIVLVENAAAQEFIVQFARDYGRIPVRGFVTGRNKAHPEFGVEGLAVEMQNGLWVIPSVNGRPASKDIAAWIEELLYYDPREHTGDRLMACVRTGGLVTTRHRGLVPIENVEVGEAVLTHLGRWRPVTRKTRRLWEGMLVTLTPRHALAPLGLTPDHRVWSAASAADAWGQPVIVEGDSEDWCPAECLSVARPNTRGEDLVLSPARGGGWQCLERVGREPYRGDVHNLEVAEDESYCVSGVAVHNSWFAREGARQFARSKQGGVGLRVMG